MNKIRAGLVAAAGAVVGVVTLRGVRKRPDAPQESTETDVEAVSEEVEEAVEHAAAAADHARAAAEKTIEYVEAEIGDAPPTDGGEATGTERPAPVRRLRRVGKGWIRR